MNRMRLAVSLAITLLAGGGLLLTEQLWLGAKAAVAELLIGRAFAAHLADGLPHPPWSWADTYPIARLEVPRLGVDRIVLAGASGPSMAFGPGHIDGSVRPGRRGNCAVAGHRDSWFAFLEELQVGDEINLLTKEGLQHYTVSEIAVHSMWATDVLRPTSESRLTLITCFPFNGLRGSDRRYVVTCSLTAGGFDDSNERIGL